LTRSALSLGVDLGFAQLMEHVLRQCLIALRCWSMSDATLTPTSRRNGSATISPSNRANTPTMRLVEAGKLPVHRFRVGLELAEFMEVAHRVSGIAGATALARRRAAKQFDPALAAQPRGAQSSEFSRT
jgi:hypothetical protein